MSEAHMAGWITIGIGLLLIGASWYSTRYFRRQVQILGTNWVIFALYRTCLTVTVVASVLTLTQAVVLALGPQPWLRVINGVALVWLLLLPILLRHYFEAHEGG